MEKAFFGQGNLHSSWLHAAERALCSRTSWSLLCATAHVRPPERDVAAVSSCFCDHRLRSSSHTLWRNDCVVEGVSCRNQEIRERY